MASHNEPQQGYGCGHEEQTWQLLHGDLDGSVQEASLAHLRRCAWCRETVESRARDVRRDLRPASETADTMKAPKPFFLGGLFGKLVTQKGPRSLMLGAGIAVVVLLVFTRGSSGVKERPSELQAAMVALSQGNPWVIEPAGDITAVPRSVSAWIPLGATAIDLSVRDAGGDVVWRTSMVVGRAGVLSAGDSLTVGNDTVKVTKVAIPVPAEAESLLQKGATYGLTVGCGVQASPARAFRIVDG